MKKQSLNGIWEYRVGQTSAWTEKEVPSSHAPVGHSEWKRTFDLTEPCDRIFLQFEGITYAATVILNGIILGDMGPYCRYTFEITDSVKPFDNELTVLLEDIAPVFGPSEGWENYGGICRDVSIIGKNKSILTDVFFRTDFPNGFDSAEITVSVTSEANTDAEYRVTLKDGTKTVLQYTQKASETEVAHTVQSIRCWTPEDPYLYTLEVELWEQNTLQDIYVHRVGFRQFSHNGKQFTLNGIPYYLHGVCRHDIRSGQGHTMTEAQMREDMTMIKNCGCNFVRLVHYPHHKKILEIADEIGLFVSEEPGLWWSDMTIPENCAGSIEVLRRTILRDRNHACIAFWLCFNECHFTEKFLADAAKTCRMYDPTRLVSGANCMNYEDTRLHYAKCGFDFYTFHPYSATPERLIRTAEELCDKPLMFTEWGGFFVYNNPRLFADFIQCIRTLKETQKLTGDSFWFWTEIMEYNRQQPACIEGVLREGLLDIHRKPTMIFDTFRTAWEEPYPIKSEDLYRFQTFSEINGHPLPCLNPQDKWQEAMTAIQCPIPRYAHPNKRIRLAEIGPRLAKEEYEGVLQTPLVLCNGTTYCFSCEKQVQTLTWLGAVSINGYPTNGIYGELAATWTILYKDGTEDVYELRNGIDFTTVFKSYGPSEINPIGEKTVKTATFFYNKNHEFYQINQRNFTTATDKKVRNITIRSENNGYILLIYGIYAM